MAAKVEVWPRVRYFPFFEGLAFLKLADKTRAFRQKILDLIMPIFSREYSARLSEQKRMTRDFLENERMRVRLNQWRAEANRIASVDPSLVDKKLVNPLVYRLARDFIKSEDNP